MNESRDKPDAEEYIRRTIRTSLWAIFIESALPVLVFGTEPFGATMEPMILFDTVTAVALFTAVYGTVRGIRGICLSGARGAPCIMSLLSIALAYTPFGFFIVMSHWVSDHRHLIIQGP